MASENYAGTNPIPMIATAAVIAHRLVKFGTGAMNCTPTVAITELALGVSLTAAAAGEQAQIQSVSGTTAKITAQAAISAGAEVMPYAAGGTAADAGKCVTAAGATAVSCGVALEAALADGDIITVLFRPGVRSPANT